jgi:hypothetical protein
VTCVEVAELVRYLEVWYVGVGSGDFARFETMKARVGLKGTQISGLEVEDRSVAPSLGRAVRERHWV